MCSTVTRSSNPFDDRQQLPFDEVGLPIEDVEAGVGRLACEQRDPCFIASSTGLNASRSLPPARCWWWPRPGSAGADDPVGSTGEQVVDDDLVVEIKHHHRRGRASGRQPPACARRYEAAACVDVTGGLMLGITTRAGTRWPCRGHSASISSRRGRQSSGAILERDGVVGHARTAPGRRMSGMPSSTTAPSTSRLCR